MQDEPNGNEPEEKLHTNKARKARKPYAERKFNVKPRIQKALDEGNIQEVIDALQPRQRLFAEEYLKDFNGSKAVVRAGYTTQYPNKVAHQMLQNPGVRAAIDALLDERRKDAVVDVNYVLNKITKTLERAESQQNHTAVLRAAELLAKHLGMFIERTELTGKDGEAIKYQEVANEATDFLRAIDRLSSREGESGDTEQTLN